MDIIIDLQRLESENEYQYLWRLGQKKDTGSLDLSWDEVAVLMNREFREDESEYRSESAYRKSYTNAKKFYEAGVFNKLDEDTYFKELQIQKRELEKTRKKLQTEKLEYSKFLREDARDEMITEQICTAISSTPSFNIPEYIEPLHTNESYLCVFTDAHYGIEFEIKDLFGNTLNAYSPEIFEERMWNMFNQIVEIIRNRNINELNLWELGDGIDGIIRLSSQLMKLRYGVIEASIRYATFIANWINELSKFVRIKYQMVVDSNHCQLRLCNAPKNSFTEENMSKVMLIIIKEKLKNNANVTIIENPTGMNYGMFSTYSVLGYHGESKNAEKSINEFSRAYQTPIDYVIGGHIHHSISLETGIRSEVLGVRSIIGVDPYGISLNKTSDPGASMFIFDQIKGLTCEYKIKLNC